MHQKVRPHPGSYTGVSSSCEPQRRCAEYRRAADLGKQRWLQSRPPTTTTTNISSQPHRQQLRQQHQLHAGSPEQSGRLLRGVSGGATDKHRTATVRGHFRFCLPRTVSHRHDCPICRTPIERILRVFQPRGVFHRSVTDFRTGLSDRTFIIYQFPVST